MRTITIKSGQLGRFDDGSPFLLEDGALKLHFVLPQVSGKFYLTYTNSFENGQTQDTLSIPASGDISLNGLKAGTLFLEVALYMHGEQVDRYRVESILLKNVDGSISGTPEIYELREKMSVIEKMLETLKKDFATRFDDDIKSATMISEKILRASHTNDINFLA